MPSKQDPAALARFVARRLRERGLSLRALGRASGIAHSTLSRLLRGQLRPTPAVLVAIAPHIGEPLPALLARAGLAAPPDPGEIERLLPSAGLDPAILRQDLQRLAAESLDPARRAEIVAAFTRKLKRAGPQGPVAARLRALYDRYVDPAQPEPARRLAGGALLYFLQPADRIDDALLSLGYLDDAVVAELAWTAVQRLTEDG